MEFLLSKIMNRSKGAVESADQALPDDPAHFDTIAILEPTTDESPAGNANTINNKIGVVKKTTNDKIDVGGIIENSGSKGFSANITSADDKSENVDTSIGSEKGIVLNSTDKQQNRFLQKKTDLSKSDKERSEISSTSDNYNSNVLPDIVNVQPNVLSTEADHDDSLILALTSNLNGLQIGAPKGTQEPRNFPQSIRTSPNSLTVNNDALSAVSSDDEVFSECQTYNEAHAMDDGNLDSSIHWENVVSSVTTGCSDNLDNTLEQIEPSTTDLQQTNAGASNSSDTVTSCDSDSTVNNETDILNGYSNQNDIETEQNADTTSNIESIIESLPAQMSATSSEVPRPDTHGVQASIQVENEKSEPNKIIIPEVRIDSVHTSPSKTPEKQILNGTFDTSRTEIKDISHTPAEKVELNYATTPPGSLNRTVNLTENSPTSTNTTFAASNTLNGTFNASPTNENFDDLTTDSKAEKCHENQLKAVVTGSPGAPEPMDVDDIGPEAMSPSFNSTQVVCKDNTPEKTNPNTLGFFFENLVTDQLDVTFKAPRGPAPHGSKRHSLEKTIAIDDSDFSTNGIILNPSDFDFLLSKGNDTVTVERSSLLLKFDPLLRQPVPVNQQQTQQLSQKQRSPPFQGNKSINSTRNASHFEASLSPAPEEEDSQASNNFLHDQFALESNSDISRASFNCTVPVGGGDEISLHSTSSLNANVSESDTNVPSTHSPPNFHENQKLLKERLNRRQPEVKKSNAKMSVDVIQDMKIENDTKSIDHINSQTDEKHDYKMAELEKKIKNETLKTEDVEKKLKEAEQREEALLKRIAEKDRTITKMSGVLEAYEKAIAELIAEKEQITQNYEKQLAEIKSDRDQNYQHLTSLEATFSDLHAKYERSKQVAATLKTNEEILLAEKKQNLENLRLQEQRYDKMKNHAMQQLEIANNKLETLTKNHSVEVTKLKALLKKEEISRLSVNEQLQQKSRENEELVKICDELINGQGSS